MFFLCVANKNKQQKPVINHPDRGRGPGSLSLAVRGGKGWRQKELFLCHGQNKSKLVQNPFLISLNPGWFIDLHRDSQKSDYYNPQTYWVDLGSIISPMIINQQGFWTLQTISMARSLQDAGSWISVSRPLVRPGRSSATSGNLKKLIWKNHHTKPSCQVSSLAKSEGFRWFYRVLQCSTYQS